MSMRNFVCSECSQSTNTYKHSAEIQGPFKLIARADGLTKSLEWKDEIFKQTACGLHKKACHSIKWCFLTFKYCLNNWFILWIYEVLMKHRPISKKKSSNYVKSVRQKKKKIVIYWLFTHPCCSIQTCMFFSFHGIGYNRKNFLKSHFNLVFQLFLKQNIYHLFRRLAQSIWFWIRVSKQQHFHFSGQLSV